MIAQQKERETRNYAVDLAAGILILWIMMFHAMNGSKVFGEVDARVALPFLTFSMPWFFYRSGLYYKPLSLHERLKKDAKKLLMPFLKWSAIGYAVWLAMQAIDGTFTLENCVIYPLQTFWIYGYIPANVPMWFVLSLFFVRLISDRLLQWSVPPVASMAVGLGIGFGLHLMGNPVIPFYVPNIAMGIAFFMLGHRFGKSEMDIRLTAVCIVGYVAFLVFGASIVGHHRNILLSGYYLLWPLFAYCGIVTFNNLCRWIDRTLTDAKCSFRPVTLLGRHTITLLTTHALVYFPLLHYSTLTPWQTVSIIVTGYLAIIILLVSRLHNSKSAT